MSTKKKNVTNIITPLAAAFLTAEPEEEVVVPAKPQSKKPAPRPVVKPAEVKIGELTKEETRALLKEQLVAGVIDDKALRPEAAEDEVPFAEEAVEKAPEKKAAPKKDSGAKKEKAPAKEDKKEPAAKKEAPTKKAEEKRPEVKKAETKKPEPKKPEVKKAEAKKLEPKKPEVKKAEAKKPEPKKPEVKKAEAKKPEAKKAEEKKAEDKKTGKEAGSKEELYIEYAGSSYSREELMNKALKVWTSVLKRGRNELHTMELYIKPQEKTVYYVFNGKRKGSFDL